LTGNSLIFGAASSHGIARSSIHSEEARFKIRRTTASAVLIVLVLTPSDLRFAMNGCSDPMCYLSQIEFADERIELLQMVRHP
jgi:hypothetical protein